MTSRYRCSLPLALSLLAVAVAAPTIGVAQSQVTATTGAFRNTAAIESELKRGVSPKADVQRVLGLPSGTGAAFFPVMKSGGDEVWYYEDIEVTGLGSAYQEGTVTVLPLNTRQQVVLIFFEGDTFDGNLWFSNVQRGEVYGR